MSLGADLIVVAGIVNKASGFYGLLSLLTGAHIGVLSWILHIFSLVLLPIYIYAFCAVRARNALYMLSFVHLYFIDTLVDIGFTIAFCVKWFSHARAVAAKASPVVSDIVATTVATTAAVIAEAKTIATFAAEDFMSSIEDDIDLTATPVEDADFSIATAPAVPELFERAAAAIAAPSNESASVARESAVSIIFTVFLLLVRIYFTFVLIGFARQLVRQQNLRRYNGAPKGSFVARLQQVLLTPFESFWTGFSSQSSTTYSPLMNRNHRQLSPNSSDATLLGNPDNYLDEADEIDLESDPISP